MNDFQDPTTDPVGYPVLQAVLLASRRSCHGEGNWYLQEGDHAYKFSIVSHAPGWRNAAKPGIGANVPFFAVVGAKPDPAAALPEAMSFFTASSGNVVFSTIKKGEDDDSVVVRCYDIEGRDADVEIGSFAAIGKAEKVNMIEEEGNLDSCGEEFSQAEGRAPRHRDAQAHAYGAREAAMTPYVTAETLPFKTAAWLDTVAAHNRPDLRLEKSGAALLVIDMQIFFLDPASPSFTCGGLAILPNIRDLVDSFRSAGRPVIYTRHAHHPEGLDAGIMGWWWKGMCREGTPESEIVPELAPRAGEKVVVKRRYSAFYNTDLETVLRCQGVRDLVISGIMTNMCCETTARDAYMRDHRVFFLADGTGSITEEMHVASLVNLAFGFAVIDTCRSVSEAVRA